MGPGRETFRTREGQFGFFISLTVPSPFIAHSDEWLMLPSHHIFGSEESSQDAPAIIELMAKSYVGLSAEDASRMDVVLKDQVNVSLNGEPIRWGSSNT